MLALLTDKLLPTIARENNIADPINSSPDTPQQFLLTDLAEHSLPFEFRSMSPTHPCMFSSVANWKHLTHHHLHLQETRVQSRPLVISSDDDSSSLSGTADST